MKVLFITRTYPPLVGGMERFASDFFNNYRKVDEIDLLANPGGKKAMILFLFKVIIAITMRSRKYDVIHIYDAVLFPLVPLIRVFSRARVSFTVNGLDIVYSRFGYQNVMPFFLRKADRIFAISRHTMVRCEARGIPSDKLVTIPVGIDVERGHDCPQSEKDRLFSKYEIPSGGKILLTVGRLVKRKGHAWFIKNVFGNLPEDYMYVVAGNGPEFDEIQSLIRDLSLDSRIRMLNQVSEEEKNCLYQIADLFIMPNVSVKGDEEGFGIVVLEAGQHGLPVIATNIEGIRDTVIEGQTGRLIEERDARGFIEAIKYPGVDPATIVNAVESNFNWKNISRKYNEEFLKMITGRNVNRPSSIV